MQQSGSKRKREEGKIAIAELLNAPDTPEADSAANLNQVTPIYFTITETLKICFANEQNKYNLREQVGNWLADDYYQKGKQSHHFFHNISTIYENFNVSCGMIVTNEKGHLVGFMTWIRNQTAKAEINIVEVNEYYRGKGVFKKMLIELSNKYPNIFILTAHVIPQSQHVFAHLGWQNTGHSQGTLKAFYHLIQPGVEPVDELPDGHVIAICPEDYYEVADNFKKYQNQMKYYKVDLDGNQLLLKPIIAESVLSPQESSPNGYVAVYFNREFITSGKVKHILESGTFDWIGNILVIDQIKPNTPELFIEKGFLKDDEQTTLLPQRYKRQTIDYTNPSTNPYSAFNQTQKEKDTEAEYEADREESSSASYSP